MFGIYLSYLSLIGVTYIVVAAYGMMIWGNQPRALRPRIGSDPHCISEAVIGVAHIVVDVLVHLPIW